MSASLPGVRIGPMDPDAAESFGQVDASTTARQLIRHHARMYPAELQRALSLGRNEPRSNSLVRGEVLPYVAEDLPEGTEVTGIAIRGEDDSDQYLTYTYRVSVENGGSGRVTKGAIRYSADEFPESAQAGDEATEIERAKEAGLPYLPAHFRTALEKLAGGSVPQSDEELTAENDSLRAERASLAAEKADLEARLADAEAKAAAAEANADAPVPEPEPTDAQPLDEAPPEPWPGYGDLTADEVKPKLRAGEEYATRDIAEKVVAFENANAKRRTVLAAADAILDHSGADA